MGTYGKGKAPKKQAPAGKEKGPLPGVKKKRAAKKSGGLMKYMGK